MTGTDLSQLFDKEYFVQVLFNAARIIRTWLGLLDFRKVAEVEGELMNIMKRLKDAVHETGVACKTETNYNENI